MMKCSKTSSGKHDWDVKIRKDIFGTQNQYRRCQKCGYRERLEQNVLSGRKRWVPA